MWRDRRDINIWPEPCRRYPLRTEVWMTWVRYVDRDILMERATGK